jgi:hypothetical protein
MLTCQLPEGHYRSSISLRRLSLMVSTSEIYPSNLTNRDLCDQCEGSASDHPNSSGHTADHIMMKVSSLTHAKLMADPSAISK